MGPWAKGHTELCHVLTGGARGLAASALSLALKEVRPAPLVGLLGAAEAFLLVKARAPPRLVLTKCWTVPPLRTQHGFTECLLCAREEMAGAIHIHVGGVSCWAEEMGLSLMDSGSHPRFVS